MACFYTSITVSTTLVPAMRSPNRTLSDDVNMSTIPKILNAGSPSTKRRAFRIKLLISPGFLPPVCTTLSPRNHFPNVAPGNPSRTQSKETSPPGNQYTWVSDKQTGVPTMIGGTQNPHTLTNRVTGKKTTQNNKKSTSKARKRGQRPAKRSFSFKADCFSSYQICVEHLLSLTHR